MTDIITREVSSSDLKELVNKLIPDSMSVDITKACQGIYPLHDVHIRKVSFGLSYVFHKKETKLLLSMRNERFILTFDIL